MASQATHQHRSHVGPFCSGHLLDAEICPCHLQVLNRIPEPERCEVLVTVSHDPQMAANGQVHQDDRSTAEKDAPVTQPLDEFDYFSLNTENRSQKSTLCWTDDDTSFSDIDEAERILYHHHPMAARDGIPLYFIHGVHREISHFDLLPVHRYVPLRQIMSDHDNYVNYNVTGSRLVIISPLPSHIQLGQVLKAVAGGCIFKAQLVPGLTEPNSVTALVSFVDANNAEQYATWTQDHPVCFYDEVSNEEGDEEIQNWYPTVKLSIGKSYPLPLRLLAGLYQRHRWTRFIVAHHFAKEQIRHLFASLTTNYPGSLQDSIVSVEYANECNTLTIEMSSIQAALEMREMLLRDPSYRTYPSEPRTKQDTFLAYSDPTDRPLDSLLKTNTLYFQPIRTTHNGPDWKEYLAMPEFDTPVPNTRMDAPRPMDSVGLTETHEAEPQKTYTIDEWVRYMDSKRDLTWYKKEMAELSQKWWDITWYDHEKKIVRYGPKGTGIDTADFWKEFEYDNIDSDDPEIQKTLDMWYEAEGKFNVSKARRLMGRYYAPAPPNLWGILKGNK